MIKLWQYLFPVYGKYGGPGWSGGIRINDYRDVDWSVEPVDSLDQCFYNHDKDYQYSIELKDENKIELLEKYLLWIKADEKLVKSIKEISANPKEWDRPPVENSIKYAWFYRKAALIGFWFKIIFCKWKNKKK